MGGSSKKVTVGYKYYVGMHMALCHGPVDKLVRIRVGGKKAWVGENGGGALSINKPDLFGGEKREGGVSGQVDIEMGGPAQGQNGYLATKLGSSLLPAFRGVCCAVLRQVYIGLNPYMKDWGWLLQRIHKRQNGQPQWYDEKAEIGYYFVDDVTPASALPYKDVFLVGSLWRYRSVPDSDLVNYVGKMTNTGFGPLASSLPHPTNNPPFLQESATMTQVPVLDRLWAEIEIRVTDRRPVIVTIKADNGLLAWVDGVQIAVGAPTSFYIYTLTITPTAKVHTLTVCVIETRQSIDPPNWKYLDAYAYQGPVENGAVYHFGDYADMNPAHIIRECLTDTNWGLGYSESDIDEVSFVAAANTLYAEKMGISILWSQQTSIEDFVGEILRHIDAALYVDRTTGKFELKLIRGDYNEASLLVLDKSNISRVEGYTKQTLAELVNEITVSYNSNETGQVETVTLQNLAMIQQQGAIIPASVDYPGFANAAIISRVAARDLKSMSTPLVTATIYANRLAAGLNIGDVFKWNWTEEDEGGAGVATSYVMRVAEIAFGDGVDNVVRIQCVQDVFALPDITYVEAEPTEWVNPSTPALPASPRLVTETPYYEIVRQLGNVDATAKLTSLPELGYLMVAAGRPTAEINAELQIDSGAGYADGGALEFCPCAALDGAIGYLDTTATLKNGVDLDEFVAGSLAQIDDEIIVIESITDGVATIRRGCLDTVPSIHADGAGVIIWDGYMASDEVEYVSSEALDVKILTVTGEGLLNLEDAPVDSVTMDQRAARPYPPANVKISGEYYPAQVDGAAGFGVTWVHRDRLQQTGETILGFTDETVGPESGTTYSLRIIRTADEYVLESVTGESGNFKSLLLSYSGSVRLELWSVRDSLESFQKFEHTFNHTLDGALWTAEHLAAWMWFDASDSSTITLDGSSVTQWADKSGNSHVATQSTASKRPALVSAGQNGLDVIRFAGDDVLLTTELFDSPASRGCIFVVYKQNEGTTNGALLSTRRDSPAGGWTIRSNSPTELTYFNMGGATSPSTSAMAPAISGYNISGLVRNGLAIYHTTNGAVLPLGVSSSFSASSFNATAIGAENNGASSYLYGDICEIIVLDYVPNNYTREKIEGYLAHKWGLTANLPSSHQYKSAAPLVEVPPTPETWTPVETTTIFWLDASDGDTVTLNGTAVNNWNDKKGGSVVAMADNIGSRPALASAYLNGLDALSFDGANDYLVLPSFTVSAGIEMFFVVGQQATGSNRNGSIALFTSYTTLQPHFGGGPDSAANQDWYDTFFSTSRPLILSDALPPGNYMGSVAQNGTQIVGRLNGAQVGAASATFNGSPVHFIIAGTKAGTPVYSKMTFCELVMVQSPSSDTRLKLEGYLAHKWGLTASLPSDHPYKSTPPSI